MCEKIIKEKEIKKGSFVLILILILVLTSFSGCLEDDKSSDKEIVEKEDKTPPRIIIISPKEDELLEGKVKIKVDVEDESEVRLAFYINEGLKQNDFKRYYNWDTTIVDDGEHTIKVIAVDESENQAVDSITVKTDNTENELPEISIDYPSNKDVVNDIVKIEGTAFDNDGKIEMVEIKIDDEWFIVEDASGDWSGWCYDWESKISKGYNIIARATDNEGGISETEIFINVDNTPIIEINSPENGALINGDFEINTDITGSFEIEKIYFYMDDDLVYIGKSETYSLNSMDYEDDTHTIDIIATDIVGNSLIRSIDVVIDNTPPYLIIKNLEENSFLKGIINVMVEAHDNTTDVEDLEFFIDNNKLIQQGEIINYKWDTLDFSDGEHEVKLLATDILGNKNEVKIPLWIDNSPPILIIENPNEDSFVNGLVNIEVEAYDNTAIENIEIYIDDEFVQNGENYEWNTLIYSDGKHEIKVIAQDILENKIEEIILVDVDNTAPTIEIKEPESQSWVNDMIFITANVNDDGSGIKFIAFFVDDTVIKNGTDDSFNWDTNQYNNGEHEIKVESSDKLGNINTLSMFLNVDNNPPTFKISSPKNNEFVRDIITIEIENIYDNESGADFADSISFFIGEDLIKKATPEFNNIANCELDTKGYDDGEYEINVEILDRLGNKNEKFININIDNTPPSVEIIQPKEGELLKDKVTIGVDGVDEGSGIDIFDFYIDDEKVQSGIESTYEWDTLKYEDGEHNIKIIVFDVVENSNETEISVIIDNTPPEIEILKPREHSKVHDEVTIEVNVNDASEIDYIEFLIDDESVQKDKKESFDWDTSDYDEEEHEIKIIAEDELGNRNQEEITVTVDNINPMHVDITEPHNNEAVRGEIRIKAEVETDEGAEVDYITFYIDDQPKQNSTQSNYQWNTKSFSNGWHTIKVEGGDTDGNTNDDEIQILVDNKKPNIEITNPNNEEIVSAQITIEVNADDEHSGIKYIDFRIDDISVQNDTKKSYDLDTYNYDDGEHEIIVFISDKAENENQDEITILIDNTEPEIEITNPTNEWVKGTINIEVDIVEDGSGIDYIDFKIKDESKQNSTKESYSWDTKNYDDGPEYNIEVTAADNVENSNTSVKIVGIDNTPPDLDITSPTSSKPYVRGEFRIETSASDTGSGLDNMSFSIDDSEMQKSTMQHYDWDTTSYGDGWHEIKVIAWDKVGNSIIKTLDSYVDNTLPYVKITYPKNNAELEEDADEHISADACDNESGLEKVEFYIDEMLKLEDPDEPFRFDFNTGDYTNGEYYFDVHSYDKAGNKKIYRIKVKIGEVEEQLIKDPHTNFLGNGYDVGNAERINVDDYTQIPVISSIVKRGITPSLGWDGSQNTKNTFNVPDGDQYSKYSGKIALAYWDTPEKAIVVDNYKHALLMSQYAAVKDYPIIVYQGNKQMTDEALYKLQTVWPSQIIVCGNTPYNNQGVTVFNENDVQQLTIDAAKFEGIDLDYITVVNPGDSTANTAYLSSFGGVFTAFHDGILIQSSAGWKEINEKIHDAIDLLADNGMNAEHICIVGDHISLQFINEGGTPSDNRYADLDGDKYTIEISIGRVFGKELDDMSYYIDRVINYVDYMDQSPIRLQRLLDPFGWRNNAVIYMGIAAEFAEDSENHCREFMWAQGQFNTQDDTGEAHMVNTPKLMADFSMSNFIIINADHGMPTGTVTFSSGDLQDLHPGICFGVSCSVGRVDGVNKQNSLTYTFLEKGIMAWLAPTRTAYGSFVQTYPYQPIAAPGLCYLYLREILANDLTSGEAMKNAKNRLIAEGIGGNVDKTTTWQYQHYGDPAFNPYEPNHEGMP